MPTGCAALRLLPCLVAGHQAALSLRAEELSQHAALGAEHLRFAEVQTLKRHRQGKSAGAIEISERRLMGCGSVQARPGE